MKFHSVKFACLLSLVATTVFSSSLMAQNQPQNPQQTIQPRPSQTPQTPSLSEVLASKLYLANHCEIKLSKMATEKAKNSDVKQFAQMLANDHSQLNERIKSMVPQKLQQEMDSKDSRQAGPAGSDRNDNLAQQDRPGAVRNPGAPLDRTQTSDRTQPGSGAENVVNKLCEIEKIAAMKSSEAITKMLEEKSSEEFDMAFVGSQIASHTHMIACLEAIKEANVNTPELQPVIDQAHTKMKEHLNKAKELANQLKDSNEKDSSN